MFNLRKNSKQKPETTKAEAIENMRQACGNVRGWFAAAAIICIVQLWLCATTVSYCLREASATCGNDWWLALWTSVEGVAATTDSSGVTHWGSAMTIIMGLGLSAVLLLVICVEGIRCFKAIAEADTPFTPEVVKHMKVIYWLIVVLVFYPFVLAYPVNLLCPAGGAAVSLSNGLTYEVTPLNAIIFLWIIVALVRAFEYGCILQRQDDELI